MRSLTLLAALALLTLPLAVGAGMPTPEDPAATTFQELMEPAIFPDAQMGMNVEASTIAEGMLRIQTTGADIEADLTTGDIRFAQRIGHQRTVAVMRIGKPLAGATVTHSGPGFARVTFTSPAMTIRVNGDSLFMLHAQDPIACSVDRSIAVAWHASHLANHLIADEWGAFGLFCSDQEHDDHFDPFATTVARYDLRSDDVLWLGVCPPKPYDWKRSVEDNVVWHWSNTAAYPTDDVLNRWREYGNTVLLQSEMLLWKDWNLAFVPRLGNEEFARVRKTIHEAGMRFIVYTSPYYFLKGTALEPQAINTFEGFSGWPPGTANGENMGLFLPEIRRVMDDYKPDGLYFDGQYTQNPAALYALARESRNIVGEDGILEWHSTAALGAGYCSLPQADAYVDFVLRGEGSQSAYENEDYLRFFVSGYNVHNSIGVLCNNGAGGINPKLARDVLNVNGRFHTIAGWLDNPAIMKVLDEDYAAALRGDSSDALRKRVEDGLDARQTLAADKTTAMRAAHEALAMPPVWGQPVFALNFDSLPQGDQLVSQLNPNPFTVANGVLEVDAHANTYAFLRIPLGIKAGGVVVRLRQGDDGGQSWGPGVMLRWEGGAGLRLGTRSDNTLQSDVMNIQQIGSNHNPSQWVYLRARWKGPFGVIERSLDGQNYERVWTFEHGGLLNAETAELLVGKVPFNGEPEDYQVAGEIGKCAFDFVEVFGGE